MARKKSLTLKDQPLEETPAFLAVLAELPSAAERDVLDDLAAVSKALFNDAIFMAVPDQADLAQLRWEAVVYRLNGDCFFGCAADDGPQTRLLAQLAAEPGQVPGWGQDGEWLMEVQGMRMWVKADNSGSHVTLGLNAVDIDQPFLSPAGYRSCFIHPRHWLGHEFVSAVRLEIERQLPQSDWQPVPISAQYRASRAEDLPAWLAPAMDGVTRNGQQALPLSGRAPVEVLAPVDDPKVPMSNVERQRAFRRRQKEKREQAKSVGVQSIALTSAERCVLSLGLLAHEDLNHRGSNWVNDKKPEFDHLLQKLWPEGDNGRYLAEPERSTYRPADRLRREVEGLQVAKGRAIDDYWRAQQEITALRQENAELKAGLQEIAAEFAGTAKPAKPVADVAALQEQVAQLRKALDVEQRERALLLDERNSGHTAALEACREQVAALRAKCDKAHNDHISTTAELGRALKVTEGLQRALEKAGLPHDYRHYL